MKLLKLNGVSVYVVFVMAAIAVVAIIWALGGLTEENIATALLALLGTFAGAMFAFRLNQNKDQEAESHRQKLALRRAMFVIARQLNAILNLQRDFHKFSAGPDRAFNLPALQSPGYEDLVQKFEDLEFLLDSHHVSLLMEMAIEQDGFHQAIESLRVRNTFYVNEVQPAIASQKLNGRSLTRQELEEALGERLFWGSINSIKNSSELIDISAKQIPILHAALFDVAKALYPNDRFIKYVPTETYA